ETVRVLVMLVGADAIESALRRVQELVQRPVVVLADPAGVGKLPPGRCDPDGFVALLEVRGELPVGHQVEGADLHGLSVSLVPWRPHEAAELATGERGEADRRAILEIRSDRLQPDRQAAARAARRERRRRLAS